MVSEINECKSAWFTTTYYLLLTTYYLLLTTYYLLIKSRMDLLSLLFYLCSFKLTSKQGTSKQEGQRDKRVVSRMVHYYLLLTTYNLLSRSAWHYSFLTPTYYLLLTTHYSLLTTTYYLLLTTYYLLPTTYYLLLTTCSLVPHGSFSI